MSEKPSALYFYQQLGIFYTSTLGLAIFGYSFNKNGSSKKKIFFAGLTSLFAISSYLNSKETKIQLLKLWDVSSSNEFYQKVVEESKIEKAALDDERAKMRCKAI